MDTKGITIAFKGNGHMYERMVRCMECYSFLILDSSVLLRSESIEPPLENNFTIFSSGIKYPIQRSYVNCPVCNKETKIGDKIITYHRGCDVQRIIHDLSIQLYP
jgi:hypothetical protein